MGGPEDEPEAATRSDLALDFDLAAVSAHDVLHEESPSPYPPWPPVPWAR